MTIPADTKYAHGTANTAKKALRPILASANTGPTTDLKTNEPWWQRTACASADLALFDPANRHEAERATAVCLRCHVRRECLLEALTEESTTKYGPWLVRGGMTPRERRGVRDTPDAHRALVVDLTESLAHQLRC